MAEQINNAASLAALYRLKPLEWKRARDDEPWWLAESPFGTIHIEGDDSGGWQWRYCVDEYYDEGSESCDSLEDGQAKAQAFVLGRLLPWMEREAGRG